ncbi:MAG: radical SAM family heme chaperone HemW [Acidaminococcaceae bacterium]|nr:radical SAM family heme chaperone HemW [Acidaminococcaceae bacterium]
MINMMERWEQFQGVYVHTPFCLQKCLYCDFPSYAGFTEAVRQQYVEALCREIKVRSLQRELPVAENATVYFGGGTPTVLSVGQIQNIVACLKEYGWWKEPAEATIEANPGTVDAEKLKALREIGFDRISLGVQSLQNNELRALGRIHSAEEALRAIEEAKLAGFQRVNADLMSGIPCQTVESFRDTMNQILQMNLSHISAYGLILEEGTPLERLVSSGRVTLPDEDISYLMYEMTTEILAQEGLRRYEISNYAKPGQESLHNIVYWHYEPYAAFGVGACTFNGKERRTNTADVQEYIKGWRKEGSVLQNDENTMNGKDTSSVPVLSAEKEKKGVTDLLLSSVNEYRGLWQTEPLDRRTQISEAMIMGLRMTEGADINKMEKRFDINIMNYYGKEIQTLLDKKLAECEDGKLRLTAYGMRFGNRVFEKFI